MKELNLHNRIALLLKYRRQELYTLGSKYTIPTWHPKITWFKRAARRRNLGVPVRVWTVNKDKVLQYCCQQGIAAVITDYPEKTLAIRRVVQSLPEVISKKR